MKEGNAVPQLPVLLHVGISKTATTFLQNHFFDAHPALFNMGKPNYLGDRAWVDLFQGLIKSADYSPDPGAVGRRLDMAGMGVPMFSEENLTLDTLITGRTADRLQALFPRARILITVRRPVEWLQSLYSVELNKGRLPASKLRSIDHWLDYHAELKAEGKANCIDRMCVYDLHELYAARFGADAVLALPYEWMIEDRMAFLTKILAFAGVADPGSLAAFDPANETRLRQRISGRRAGLLRMPLAPLARQLWSALPYGLKQPLRRTIDRAPAAQHKISAEWSTRIEELCVKQHSALSAATGINLAAYGYFA
jgi:hypothetical protein